MMHGGKGNGCIDAFWEGKRLKSVPLTFPSCIILEISDMVYSTSPHIHPFHGTHLYNVRIDDVTHIFTTNARDWFIDTGIMVSCTMAHYRACVTWREF